jgi:hypothetical protein
MCSNALLMVGAQTINSFTDNSERAKQCANLYPTVRDYVISAHPWNCAIKRVVLSPNTTAPAFDWAYQFTLPGDFMRLLAVGEAGMEDDFNIEGGNILSDASILYLRYIYQNTNESTYTPLLVMAITQAMRQTLAYPVTQSSSLEQLIDQAIEPFLKKARAVDSMDQPPQTVGDFRLLNSRYIPHGNGWN